ncbi:MAG TPA: nuclear transport factor 2 family protein [Pyrinomonadaceae bacterium]|jgi:ketosteroid isomerase-like protein|nr:nuclear transport factor 2 family protein [Pyrinomonadaceae bacterium]
MRRAVIIFLLCCSPVGVMAQNTIQARKEILRLEDRWREAQHQNDKDAYDQLLSADLTFIGTSGSFRDKTGFIASRKDSWIPRSETYTYSEMTVRFYGSAAIVTGREATTGTGVAFQGRFTHMWVKRQGRWRLVAIQRTNITP